MRVSTPLIFNTGTAGIKDRQFDLFKIMNQLSTGRRILSPEDDPIGASQALMVTQSKDVNAQYIKNQGTALDKLNLTESTLGSVVTELQAIKEKAVQAGNGTIGPAEQGMIATELKERLQNLIGLANTQDGTGLYIFAGYKSTTKPFDLNVGVTPPYSLSGTYVAYHGDSGNEALQVSASRVMDVTENGIDVFMQVQDNVGSVIGRSVFDGLQNMIDILDPTSGVPFTKPAYDQALNDISSMIDHMSTVRASVGARMQSVDSMINTSKDLDFIYDSKLSDLQDLDYVDAISKLSRYQMQLEAAQMSFKRISELSLFNII